MSRPDCIFKLKNLLSTTKEKVKSISANKSQIFIFGAGNTSKLYVKCFEAENINVAGFIDNDKKKQSTAFVYGGGYLLQTF